MIKLVQRYSGRDQQEWPLLFFRILQNEIREWKRKAWIRGWLGMTDCETDRLEDHSMMANPDKQYQIDALHDKMHTAIRQLPLRQQQAFLLRNWEGLDVKQTAKAMNCTSGSVKTHYSRAIKYLHG